MQTAKITWISILQGGAMLLVVLGHCSIWTADDWRFHFCYGLHMPLFMFVSGCLFYYTRISRDWTWGAVVVDKLKRLGVPYIFFITFAFVLKVLLASLVKNQVDTSLAGFLTGFIFPIKSGMKEMWFVAALLLLMLCYPLYKWLLRSKTTVLCALFLGVAFTFAVPSYTGGGVFNWQGALRYFVFFFGGIAFFKYNLVHFAKVVPVWGSVVLLVIYSAICIFRREQFFIVAAVGILACVCLSVWAAEYLPKLFASFRDYSFQIFLLGIYPQMFIDLILIPRFTESWQKIILLGLSVILGIYVSVAVAKLVKRIDNKYLNMVFGLK